jgi:hypothetical protein
LIKRKDCKGYKKKRTFKQAIIAQQKGGGGLHLNIQSLPENVKMSAGSPLQLEISTHYTAS